MPRVHLMFGLHDIRGGDLIADALFVIYEAGGPSDSVWMVPGTWVED